MESVSCDLQTGSDFPQPSVNLLTTVKSGGNQGQTSCSVFQALQRQSCEIQTCYVRKSQNTRLNSKLQEKRLELKLKTVFSEARVYISQF